LVIGTSNSVPLVGGDRKAFGVWRSAFSVPGARGDVGVLRLRSVVRNSGSFVGQVGVSWRVMRHTGLNFRLQVFPCFDRLVTGVHRRYRPPHQFTNHLSRIRRYRCCRRSRAFGYNFADRALATALNGEFRLIPCG